VSVTRVNLRLRGDAHRLSHLLPERYHGQAALVITSPPCCVQMGTS
jgi:hypothetical protein